MLKVTFFIDSYGIRQSILNSIQETGHRKEIIKVSSVDKSEKSFICDHILDDVWIDGRRIQYRDGVVCMRSFSTRQQLIYHRFSPHHEKYEKGFRCTVKSRDSSGSECGMTFSRMKYLKLHHHEVHPNRDECYVSHVCKHIMIDEKPCGRSFESLSELQRHEKIHLTGRCIGASTFEVDEKNETPVADSEDMTEEIPIEGESILTVKEEPANDESDHQSTDRDTIELLPLSSTVYSNPDYFDQRELDIAPIEADMKAEETGFSHRNKIIKVSSVDKSEKSFICDHILDDVLIDGKHIQYRDGVVCMRSFLIRQRLINHRFSHHEKYEKGFRCTVKSLDSCGSECGMTFSRMKFLKLHHGEVHPNRDVYYVSHLCKHIMIDERPCGRRFESLSEFHRHEKIHLTGTFEVDEIRHENKETPVDDSEDMTEEIPIEVGTVLIVKEEPANGPDESDHQSTDGHTIELLPLSSTVDNDPYFFEQQELDIAPIEADIKAEVKIERPS